MFHFAGESRFEDRDTNSCITRSNGSTDVMYEYVCALSAYLKTVVKERVHLYRLVVLLLA